MSDVINTVDHDEIREWIETRDGHPAKLSDQVLEADTLRLKFDEVRHQEVLERISWDEFFQLFEEEEIVFVYEENSDTSPEQDYRFVTDQRGAIQGDVSTEMDSESVQDNILETDETESATGDKTSAEKQNNMRDD